MGGLLGPVRRASEQMNDLEGRAKALESASGAAA